MALSRRLSEEFARAGTRGRWMRDNLPAWRAARDDARAVWDAEKIIHLRAAMAESKTAAAALAWADRNGIEIIVDHRVQAGGYYWPGTGVVAISARQVAHEGFLGPAVGTLTHEIRHAWQDYHGLIYCPTEEEGATSPLGRDLAIEGLFEADADAHGKLAEAEYKHARTQQRVMMLRGLQKDKPERGRANLLGIFEKAMRTEGRDCRNPQTALWRMFTDWYGKNGLNAYYGRFRRAEYAAALGLAGPAQDHGFEYRRPAGCALMAPPDFSRRETVDLLGRSFAGVNYLHSADARDTIARFLNAPGAAERYFPRLKPQARADKGKADRLTRKIRAVQLRAQLATPAKRLPLPK